MSLPKERYGIILAGGSGTRLGDCTKAVSKHLLPVYDKPMIYYPLATLLELGIRKILIISNPENIESYDRLLGSGGELNCSISYTEQRKPNGISEAFIIAGHFLNEHPSCLILGDNIFYGPEIKKLKTEIIHVTQQAYILGYKVANPRAYGVAEFKQISVWNDTKQVTGLEEKPQKPKSNYAVPGLYFFPENAPELARTLTPSKRGELEITDLLLKYVPSEQLFILPMNDESFWFDAGTHDSLLEVSEFVAAVQKRRGIKIGCLYAASEVSR